MDYVFMSATYIRFYAGCKAQGLDRKSLPYTGYFQPYCGYIGLIWSCLIVLFYGYGSFRNTFQLNNFWYAYTMPILDLVLFIGWKLIKRTKFIGAYEMDLVWERPTIDAYEATFYDEPVR